MDRFRLGLLVLTFVTAGVNTQLIGTLLGPTTTTTTQAPPTGGQGFYQVKPAQPSTNSLTCPPFSVPQWCGNPGQSPCPTYADLEAGRFSVGSLPRPDDSLPTWFNVSLAFQGQNFAKSWSYSNLLSLVLGMASFASTPDAMAVMFNTGQAVLPATATKVALAGYAQTQVWMNDLFNSSNGQPAAPTDPASSSMLKSLNHIRQMHTAAMIKVSNYQTATGAMYNSSPYAALNASIDLPFWAAVKSDLLASAIPSWQRQPPPSYWNNATSAVKVFNQQSMALILFNVGMYPVLMPTTFGIAACDSDLYSFYHLWAGIGYALGLDDRFNPALQPDIASARQHLANIFNGYIIPGLFNMDNSTLVFIEANINAVVNLVPILTKGVGLTFFLQDVIGIPAPNTWAKLSLVDQQTYNLIKTSIIPGLLTNPIYRDTMNTVVNTHMSNMGTLQFGTDYLSVAGRASSCYQSNLNGNDYDNADNFENDYPEYYVSG